MLAEVYQPALSRAIHESLAKVIVENMPPITESLNIDGFLHISLSKKSTMQIKIKIHDTIEPRKVTWEETGSGRSSPWQIPLDKIRDAQQRFLSFNGHDDDSMGSSDAPVDLRAARDTPTSLHDSSLTSSAAFKPVNGASQSPLALTVNGSDSGSDYTKPATASTSLTQNEGCSTPASVASPGGGPEDNEQPGDLTIKASSHELKCKICSYTCVGGLPALQIHTREKHNRYVCRFCYNTFSVLSNKKRHEQLHLGAKHHKCSMCSKTFARSTDLRHHMTKHGVTDAEHTVPCTLCTRTYVSVQNLRWHLYKVHQETEATFACTICEKLFIDKDEYMKHRDDHTNNLIPVKRPDSAATTESGTDTAAELHGFDSDSDHLMIDTHSDVTTETAADEDGADLPLFGEASNNSDDVGLELVAEPRSGDMETVSAFKAPAVSGQTDVSTRVDGAPTPTPSQASVGSTSGSRKRKIGKPIKIEIVEKDDDEEEVYDLNNMYFDPDTAKNKQAQNSSQAKTSASLASQANAARFLSQTEPENLVMKARVATPPNRVVSSQPFSMAANTLSQIAFSVQQNFFAANPSLTAAAPVAQTSSFTPQQLISLRNIIASSNPNRVTQVPTVSFASTPTPILITPQAGYQNKLPLPVAKTTPSPSSAKRQKTGNVPHSITKSKIASTSEGFGENKELQCSEPGCAEVYMGFSAYEDHCMIRHGRYPCKYCKQTFSGKNNRTRHMRCHLGAKTYTCPDCNKNFSRPDSMREHQFIHTLSYQEDKCRNCGAAFDKKNMLLAHLKQCYRHKMETGKSTKYIDETPTYPGNRPVLPSPILSTSSDALAPLKPIKLENIPAFKHIDSDNLFVPSTSSVGLSSRSDVRASPSLSAVKSTSSPLNLSAAPFASLPLPLSISTPLVIAPTSSVVNTPTTPRPVFTPSVASSSLPHNSPLFMMTSPSSSVTSSANTSVLNQSMLASSLANILATARARASPAGTPVATPRSLSPAVTSATPPAQGIDLSAAASKATASVVKAEDVADSKDQNANNKASTSDGTAAAE